MKKIAITLLAAFVVFGSYAQSEQDARQYAETITKDDLYDYLSILASDALEGRETGERGQKMAAAFIRHQFEEFGLQGPVEGSVSSYYQPVELYKSKPGDTYVKVKDKKYNNFESVIYYGLANTKEDVKTEVVFAGSGKEADFDQVDVKDKSAFVFLSNTQEYPAAMQLATSKGAKILFAVTTTKEAEFNAMAGQFKNWLSGGRLSIEKPKTDAKAGVFFISPVVAQAMFGTSIDKLKAIADNSDKKSLKKVKSATVSFKTEQKPDIVKSENVLGYLEGTDKKDELLVITAHYDHEGRDGDQIYNGADDDGSGTSAVIELAEAFALAKKNGKGPRRSILFMAVTGEEKGLLGSEYYTENPIFPLENTVVNLNIDMIGRIDSTHTEKSNYVYLVGADKLSTELHEISEKANSTFTNLDLDYTYNDENHPDRIYYRSDHWNFAKNNIPVVFYFNGVHEDYHKPTDTIEKIDFDMLTKRAKLVFYTAWMVANRDQRLVVDKLEDQEINQN